MPDGIRTGVLKFGTDVTLNIFEGYVEGNVRSGGIFMFPESFFVCRKLCCKMLKWGCVFFYPYCEARPIPARTLLEVSAETKTRSST